ncbi:MAG: Gfo/Idh/MocA family oxidoreductase [Verrucomicrobiota bacterium]
MKRRSFLKTSLATGTGFLILPSGLWSQSKNSTMQIAHIGCGRMGRVDMKQALNNGWKKEANARYIAVCDVDSNRMSDARRLIEKYYTDKGESDVQVKEYEDYGEILARDDIDAVVISTPEHWHGIMGVAAANAGKHMYIQKPITYSIPEGKALVEAVRKNNIVLQTGSQQRSSIYFRQVCNIVRNKWLGELKTIEATIPTDKGRAEGDPTQPPAHFNYDKWLGPCEEVPYVESCVHPQKGYKRPGWLQVERNCLGMITGWGSHMYDIAQWGMGTDFDSGPVEITAKGEFPERGHFNVHVKYEAEALYANGVRMISKDGGASVRFIMENGWALCSRNGMKCSDQELLRRQPSDNEISLYHSKNHMFDFLTSAREGTDPVCPVEVGHRSNTICVLHHISMKMGGETVKWDPEKQMPVNQPEVEKRMNVPMRQPYTMA